MIRPADLNFSHGNNIGVRISEATMKMLAVLMVALVSTVAWAQGLSGTYTLRAPNGTVLTLNLQDNQGRLTGTITSTTGATLRLEGRSSGTEAEGTITDAQGKAYFYLALEGSTLILTITELGADGQPDESTAQDLEFTRQSGPSAPSTKPATITPPSPSKTTPAPADPFVGRFVSADITLELLAGKNGTYNGTVRIQGQVYTVNASVSNGRLNGSYRAGTTTVLFVATPGTNGLNLQLNGRTFALVRQGSTSPLSTRPVPNPPPNPGSNPTVTPQTGVRELQVGGQYPAGTRINSGQHGISFIVPRDWKAALRPDLPALLIGSDTKPGAILALAGLGLTTSDIAALLNEASDMGNGVTLQPLGQAQIKGSRVTQTYDAGQLTGRALAVIGQNGASLTFIAVGPQEQGPYFAGLLEAMAGSVQYSQAKATAAIKQYMQLISGKTLYSFSYSGSSTTNNSFGSSSERTWNVCSNGTYSYRGVAESGGNFSVGATTPQDLGGVASQSSSAHSGRWRIVVFGMDLKLVLQAQDGEVRVYTLGNNGKYLTLDGKEVTLNANQQCR
jgi:hypothetical protein